MMDVVKKVAILFLAASLFASGNCEKEEDTGKQEALLINLLLNNPVYVPERFIIGVTATPGDALVDLSWSYSGNATSYNIYFSTTGTVDTNSTKISTGTAAQTYTHTGLINGQTYFYRIQAVNGSNLGSLTSTVAAGPDSWAVANSGVSETLQSVRYFNSQFWAVGDNQTILKSADGITWTPVDPGCGLTTDDYYDIAFDGINGIRIAAKVGGKIVMSDDSGSSWSCSTVSTHNWTGINYLNNQWLMYGTENLVSKLAIAVGSDGVPANFNVGTTSTGDFIDTCNDAIYVPATGYLVMVCDDGRISRCNSNCTELANWTNSRYTLYGFGFDLYGAYYRNDSYYLVRYSGIMTIDSSFASPTALTMGFTPKLRSITDLGTEILGVGDFGEVYSSGDGDVWSKRFQPSTTNNLKGIACSASSCVAVGAAGTIIYR